MRTLVGIVLLLGSLTHAVRPTVPVTQDEVRAIDPAMELLGRLVGGTWITTGKFIAELKYEWRIPGKAIRGTGVIAKGTKAEFPSESLYGWDADMKKVYYLDFHGHDTIYKGYAVAQNGHFTGDFEGLVGDKGHYKFDDVLTDNDTLAATMYGQDKTGKWVLLHSLTFKRHMGPGTVQADSK